MSRQPFGSIWDEQQLMRFWRFTCERHDIFVRRYIQKRPAPWSTDPIMNTVFFTNIYRELDRGTRYLIKYLLEPAVGCPDVILFNTVIFRYFILPETMQAIGWPIPLSAWSAKRVATTLTLRQAEGYRIFTGAYNISNHGSTMPKVDLIVDQIDWVHQNVNRLLRELEQAPRLEACHAVLKQAPGLAGFMAYEVLIDLCYELAVLSHGMNEWVYIGPGAKRGLAQLFRQGAAMPSTRGLFDCIDELQTYQRPQMAVAGAKLHGPKLTLENIEQALCEFQKYNRAQGENGRAKRKYAGPRPDTWKLYEDLPARFMDRRFWLFPED